MGLFKKESKAFYNISPEQYSEMKKFYEKLGYDEKQVKALCENCFGAKIVKQKNLGYNEDWEFYRRIESFNDSMRGGPMAGMAFFGAPLAKMAQPTGGCPAPGMAMSETVLEDCCAPEGLAAPMPMPVPEFNTAQTHTAKEIEETSPLDKPQMIFSANVNTASWSYIRNRIMINKNIDRDFVRIEEIVNSYPYKLKKPKNDDLFSISIEHGKCPWSKSDELLFVGLKGKKAEKKVHQNLAFLVDVSGSMEDRWILVQMSLMAIISKLGRGDVISIIAYSDNTVTVVKQLECSNIDKCVKAVLDIDGIGGCTNGSQGLNDAYDYLAENYDKDANNRVFIFTDGDFNFGITGEGGLSEFIKKKRETGIYLSVVGYGMNNFKDDKMEALAKNGNGNYTMVTNPADIFDNLWEKLISNLVTVAKDVKISVELNPYYVKKYRLIGYDSRVLTQKEFNDTEKAVDGIGSEHNVAALIQFSKGTSEKTYSTRYVTAKSEGNKDEFAFIEIHYKTPEGVNQVLTRTIGINELSTAENKNLDKAALLAAFGLCVKDSEYKGDADKKLLKTMLAELPEDSKDKENKTSHYSIIKKYASE